MTKAPRAPDERLAEVKLWWYGAALLPILGLSALSLAGLLPIYGMMLTVFLFVFWLISFVFLAVAKFNAARLQKKANKT